MIDLLLLLMHMLPVPSTPADSHVVVMPAVHFKWIDPDQTWDTYDYDTPIRVEVEPHDLPGLRHPIVRLFSARYTEDAAGDPSQLSIARIKGCGIFPWRKLEWKPSLADPVIFIGRLPDSAFRCVGNELAPTDFYMVMEEGGDTGPLVRVDLKKVDDYFYYAYGFTITVPKHHPCRSGTDAADKEDQQQRAKKRRKYLASLRQSRIEQQQIGEIETAKSTCVDTVTVEQLARYRTSFAVAGMNSGQGEVSGVSAASTVPSRSFGENPGDATTLCPAIDNPR